MRNDLKKLTKLLGILGGAAKTAEGVVLSPFILGLMRSSEAIVKELQDKGPQWTGTFANSWEISSPSKTNTGTRASGAPGKITAPPLTPNEFKFQPSVKYRITNTAPHKDYALDLVEGRFYPKTDKISAKPFTEENGKRPQGDHKRGAVSPGGGKASSTAELDWYATFIQSKKVDKAIQLYMDQELRKFKL